MVSLEDSNQEKRLPSMYKIIDNIIWVYVLSMAWDHVQETFYFGVRRYLVNNN